MRFNYQLPLIDTDPLIKLGEVETILSRVFRPVPSRPTLIAWIEDGTLEGKKIGRGDNWYVYQSSLNGFIIASQPKQLAA
ncbi:MAG: hypothetical protein IPN69_08155 [Acidobacteria bacterium]|nr:hypothetical protein [Acidobacteriota bacterium]